MNPSSKQKYAEVMCNGIRGGGLEIHIQTTIFPWLERARSINCRLAPRGVVFEGAQDALY